MKKDSEMIMKRFEHAKREKQLWQQVYQDLTEYFHPYKDGQGNSQFTTTRTKISSKKPRQLFNSTGAAAAEQLVAVFHQGIINPADQWFSLITNDREYKDNFEVKRFLEAVTDTMFGVINSPESNFYNQAHEFLMDFIVYGTACIYIEHTEDDDIVFCTYPFSEIFITENHLKQGNSIMRRFTMTAEQVKMKWPDVKSDEIRQANDSEPDREFEILHYVAERKSVAKSDDKLRSKTEMPYKSVYLLTSGGEVLSESGYYENPYIISRWSRRAGEIYGRSPAWTALPDVKKANVIEKTLLEMSERISNPPILMSDDSVLTQLNLVPGSPVQGGLDSVTGQPRLMPFNVGGNLPVNLEILNRVEQAIRAKFFIGSLATYNPNVEKTATEVLEFRREELRLLSPQISKLQVEFIAPLIDRLRGILERKGILPDVPPELDGLDIELHYDSSLADLQHYNDLEAIAKTINSMVPFLQTDPTLLDTFDPEKTMYHVAKITGVPASILRSPEELAQIRQAAAQQKQNAEMQQMQMQQQAMLAGNLESSAKAQKLQSEAAAIAINGGR